MMGLMSAIAMLVASVMFFVWLITRAPIGLPIVAFGLAGAIVTALWELTNEVRKRR